MKLTLRRYSLWALFMVVAAGNGQAAQTRPLPDLQIQVVLSPSARQTLVQGKEGITVAADWYGEPNARHQSDADESGQIDMGRSELNLPSEGGTARFTPAAINSKRLGWLKEGLRVNINVYSARRHWPDNILNCEMADGPVAGLARKPVTLRCSLISELAG
ncbi:hypothetical protein HQN64_09495 [Enterobacteriaceae bacterium BIT-l23]|uniref:hypothetical protein n=1 Tax=Jejubacter sp. L23 TaxID=3092086 RepID=UPI001585050A|nr:hypothetical protein [Enterobacteriaceae bacterium BIT-l23]